MKKSYTSCPYCETHFGFVEIPQFDGSFLLTCPECNRMFGMMEVPSTSESNYDINSTLAQTSSVEDTPIAEKF